MTTGLMATMFASASLVGVSGTAATAGPYTGTVPTSTVCKAQNVERGDNGRIAVRIVADGNAEPRGNVTVRVVKNVGDFRYINTKDYDGGVIIFKTPDLDKRGKYQVTCRFDRKPNSVWKDSNNTDSFWVTRRN
ncbi:hypothetical protein [Nocardioides szechwanensis]|nr:hypothetical protein [Nocardioides szechwanensis]